MKKILLSLARFTSLVFLALSIMLAVGMLAATVSVSQGFAPGGFSLLMAPLPFGPLGAVFTFGGFVKFSDIAEGLN